MSAGRSFLKHVTKLYCVQQASCLEGGPLLWIWPLYLHVNKKSDDDDDDDDDVRNYQSTIMSLSRYNFTVRDQSPLGQHTCKLS